MFIRCGLRFVLIGLTITATRAEVSVDLTPSGVNTLILGIILDDTDPLGVAWQPFRAIPAEQILNPSGHARGDGRPDLAFETTLGGGSTAGRPIVTWAWNLGSDHDLAIAEWTGTAWSSPEFLTSTSSDDLDPRLFVEPDGTRHVVWWTAGAIERVNLMTRPAGATGWTPAIEVASGARRPTVAVVEGVIRVAFERASTVPGAAQDVVVVRREAGGAFVEEFVGSTMRTGRLDPLLHVRDGHCWLDWKHADESFGFVVHDAGAWTSVDEHEWIDGSWVGVEVERKRIAGAVLVP